MTLRLIRPAQASAEPSAAPRFAAIRTLAGRDLVWSRVRGSTLYQLHADDVLVATLEVDTDQPMRATAETADGQILLSAAGGTWKRVNLHAANGRPVAAFRERWTGGGTLTFGRGVTIKLAPTNLWRSEWVWRDEAGQNLLHWQHREQTVAPPGVHAPETGTLAVLSWFLNLLSVQSGRAGENIGFLDEPDD